MKLNEMIAAQSGVPAGFEGRRMKWDEVKEAFVIEKAAVLSRKQYTEDGEVLVYSQGARQGQPIMDRQLVLQLRTADDRRILVRTNSQRLVPLFSGNLDRPADGKNRFGDDYHIVDAPEGIMHFVNYKYEYKNGQIGNVADLEEVEE